MKNTVLKNLLPLSFLALFTCPVCQKAGSDCDGKSHLPAKINKYEALFDGTDNLTRLHFYTPGTPAGPFPTPSFAETYEFMRSADEILLFYKYDLFDGNPAVSTTVLRLDQQGRCAQSIGTDTIRFVYTADGYLAAMYFTSSALADTGRFEYQNGNLVRYSARNTKFDFEYSADLDNTPCYFQNLPVGFGRQSLEWAVFLECFGKKNKNMFRKLKLTSTITGNSEHDFSYDYDPCDRLKHWGSYGFTYSD